MENGAFIDGLLVKHCDFHGYVKLPQGKLDMSTVEWVYKPTNISGLSLCTVIPFKSK